MDITTNLPLKFWDLVDKSSPCWKWKGTKVNNYPVFNYLGQYRGVIRLITADLPSNRNVIRKCKNPECINPAHFTYRKEGPPPKPSVHLEPAVWRDPKTLSPQEKDLIFYEPKKRGYISKLIAQYGINATAIRKIKLRQI